MSTNISSLATGVILICALFSIPLAIAYSLFYHKRGGFFNGLILLAVVFLLGFTTNLMFYRVSVMNDATAQINNMDKNSALFVLGVTAAAFMIVVITLFAIGVNPSLITIFENTFGFQFIHFFGLTDLTSKIFTSKTMDPIQKNVNPSDFNYNFLITQINTTNVEEIIEYACGKGKSTDDTKFPLDFSLKFKYEEDKQKLRDLVYLKNTFGHYVWVYLSSIVALFVSMIGVTMGST